MLTLSREPEPHPPSATSSPSSQRLPKATAGDTSAEPGWVVLQATGKGAGLVSAVRAALPLLAVSRSTVGIPCTCWTASRVSVPARCPIASRRKRPADGMLLRRRRAARAGRRGEWMAWPGLYGLAWPICHPLPGRWSRRGLIRRGRTASPLPPTLKPLPSPARVVLSDFWPSTHRGRCVDSREEAAGGLTVGRPTGFVGSAATGR